MEIEEKMRKTKDASARAVIETLTVETGYLRDQRFQFAPSFNVILGGLGKGTAVELMRLAVHGESPVRPDLHGVGISATVRDANGRRLFATRSNGEPMVRSERGEPVRGTLGDLRDFRAEFYDWESIQEIGLDGLRQLVVLDRHDEEGCLRAIEARISDLQKLLAANARAILELADLDAETRRSGGTAIHPAGTGRERMDAARGELFRALESKRRERYDFRKAAEEEINRKFANRRIAVRHLAHREPYRHLLEHALDSLRGDASAIADSIAGRLSPSDLFACVQARRASELQDRAGLNEYDAKRVVDLLQDTPSIFEIQSVEIPDGSEITFLKNDEWKSAAECSQGERTLAVLPLLLRGTCPIVIRKPHRGVGGRELFEEIVPCVRAARKVRQVIFVTDSPVLVVNGEAERVVVLDDRKPGRIKCAGSLDELGEELVKWCEGGRDALRKRSSLYLEADQDKP